MQEEVRRPYKVIVRCASGQTCYRAETYPDIDAMFEETQAYRVAVAWLTMPSTGIQKDVRAKHEKMRMYAIYQAGYSILGVGHTLDAAKTEARAWIDAPRETLDTLIVCSTSSPTGDMHGACYARPCTERLVHAVQHRGGMVGYVINHAGLLDVADER